MREKFMARLQIVANSYRIEMRRYNGALKALTLTAELVSPARFALEISEKTRRIELTLESLKRAQAAVDENVQALELLEKLGHEMFGLSEEEFKTATGLDPFNYQEFK